MMQASADGRKGGPRAEDGARGGCAFARGACKVFSKRTDDRTEKGLASRHAERADRRARPFPDRKSNTSELQSHSDLVCRLLLEKKKEEQAGKRVRATTSRTALRSPP